MLEIFVICMCAAKTGDCWQKAFTSRRRQKFNAQTLSDRVGSPGQRFRPGSISDFKFIMINKITDKDDG